jgi:hypothetical protein
MVLETYKENGSLLVVIIKRSVMIGSIAIVWAVWKRRNKSCFQRILNGDPTNVILFACHFINQWAKMQKNRLQTMMASTTGASRMTQMAQEIFRQAMAEIL